MCCVTNRLKHRLKMPDCVPPQSLAIGIDIPRFLNGERFVKICCPNFKQQPHPSPLENKSAAKQIQAWCHPCPSIKTLRCHPVSTHTYNCAGLSLNQTKQRVCLLRLMICHLITTHPVSLRPISIAGFHVPCGEPVPTDSTCDGFPR